MNEDLCREFIQKEISDALIQIGPIKAPGHDGFSARFYERNWEVMREEIINVVKLLFNTGRMPDGCQ
jgi:hypothetical protein